MSGHLRNGLSFLTNDTQTVSLFSKEKLLYEEETPKAHEAEEGSKESSSSSSEEEGEDEASESEPEKEAGRRCRRAGQSCPCAHSARHRRQALEGLRGC